MKSHIFAMAAATLIPLSVDFLPVKAQNKEVKEITVTAEGDSIITFKPEFYDFGPTNPGYPNKEKYLVKEDPAMKDAAEFKTESLQWDRHLIQAAATKFRTMSASEGSDGIDRNRPVGKIPVQEGTTLTGARTYSIPITSAPAIDLTPQISLLYNSQSGNGIAGYGWSISGLPAISITNKTIYYNGAISPADCSDTTAVYSLDGMPLVRNSKTELAGEYPLETARGHIVAKKHSMANGQASHFSVLYPDGSKATFGEPGGTGASKCSWPITELEDIRGNRVLFKYTYSSGLYYISSIEYGFDDTGNPAGKISFEYEYYSNSPTQYYAGVITKYYYVLKRIISTNDGTEICRYDLSHEQEDHDHLLVRIDCTSGGKSLNPLKFSYGIEPMYPSDYRTDFTQKDQLFLSQYFNASDDVDIIYRSGKFIDVSYGDGMIALPEFETYGQTRSYEKKFLGIVTARYYEFGSLYDPEQKILVAPRLNYFSDVQTITAEAGFQCIEAADIDADGQDEIVKVNFNGLNGSNTVLKITVYEYSSSGTLTTRSAFNVEVAGVINDGDIFYSPMPRLYFFGNFKGDGKVQLMTTSFNKDFRDNPHTSYTALIDLYGRKKLSETHLFDMSSDNARCIASVDLDNDGRTEICMATASGMEIYNLSGNSFIKRKTVSGLYASVFPAPDDKTSDMFLTDINGDGYADFVRRAGKSYTAYKYNGNRFIVSAMNIVMPAENDGLMFYDINKDGLADLIHTSGTTLNFYLNQNGTIQSSYKMTSTVAIPEKTGMLPCNTLNYNSLANFITIEGGYVKTYEFSKNKSEDRLLTTFTDSHGTVTTNRYEDMSTSDIVYKDNSDRTYEAGFTKICLPTHLLYSTNTYMTSDAGPKTRIKSVRYLYSDAAYNWEGLRFCGFGKVSATDYMTETGKEKVTSVTYDPTAFGIMTATEQSIGQDMPFNTTENVYERKTTPYGKLNPRLTSSTNENTITGITTKTEYAYGDYDLPVSVTSTRTSGRVIAQRKLELNTGKQAKAADSLILEAVADNNETGLPAIIGKVFIIDIKDYIKEETRFTYKNRVSPSMFLLGQITDQTVTTSRYNVDPWTERHVFEYDSTLMLPIKRTDYAGTNGNKKVLETRWSYDRHGRLLSETSARYNSTIFIGETYGYDEDGRYLRSRTDALGLTETYGNYNRFGKPETVTDHKGRSTTITYDEWGNEISRIYPEGTTEKTILSWGGIGLYTVTRTVTGQPDEITHYDAADREVRSGAKRFDGSWLFTDKNYDDTGNLSKLSLPFKGESSSLWNTYEYDEYSRATKLTEASGNVTTWNYDKWTVKETRNAITTTRILTAGGETASISDGGGTIGYTFRADGQPSSAGRPMLSIAYQDTKNAIVNNTNFNNIHGKTEKAFPDSLNAINNGHIAKPLLLGNEMITFGYDEYGRRTSISDPSAGKQTDIETWTADGRSTVTHTNPNGTIVIERDKFGRTTKVDRKGEYATIYTYGTDGLLLGESSTNGTAKEYAYDSFDRLISETETVPDGKWLRKEYTYTAGSRISTVKYTSQSGEITTEIYTYDNGHHTSVSTVDGYTVWALTEENGFGLPSKAMTGEVERTYSYSPYGQIAGRTMGDMQNFSYAFSSATGNLTSRSDLTRSMSESFGYDSLNRLTDNNGKTITYADNGNIKSIESVGSFNYGKPSRPYQMTEAILDEGDTFRDRDQTISYTCFSRPSRLNEGGRSAAFTYNGSNDRVKMYVADGATAVLTRYYIGGQYELDITQDSSVERLYLNGDAYSSPMVLVREGPSGWIPYNIGRDYLGSITHIATADGILVAEYSYDAWGRLRNPDTHEIYLPGEEPELFLGRGFTGHEHLSWFGLINMNARLYDPVLGRFLSPDPYVQMPDFTQNFNRYSYCLNNPFVYIDEDGEFIITAIIVGAIIGAAIGVYEGYKIAEAKGATGWDKAWYMIGGGLIGGAAGVLGGWAGAATGAAVASAGIGGFLAGAASGGAAGAASGFINGFGMSMLKDPRNVGDAFLQGVYQAGIGGLSGAALGGLIQGTISATKGNNFWNGSAPSSVSISDQTPHHSVRDSYQKGIDGVNKAIDEYTAKGADLLSKEVSLDVNGTRVRLDAAFKLNGETILMEVKNGSHAGFTPNQAIAYPQMELGVPVIPRGFNAGLVFGTKQIGVPTNNYKFVIIRF